ncbi:hypothetical protein NPIL_521991, partial [Nephila pilipes]
MPLLLTGPPLSYEFVCTLDLFQFNFLFVVIQLIIDNLFVTMETPQFTKDSLSPSDSLSQGDLSSTPVALRTRLNSVQISYRDAAL